MKIIEKDITQATEDVILHQVNCQNVMGSGVAKALFTKWPQVKSDYHDYCSNWGKIGSKEELLGHICFSNIEEDRYVVNCFSQLTYGVDGKQHTNYEVVEKCFRNVIALFRAENLSLNTVAIPYGYGCGLGGGDWNIVSKIIEDVFGDKAMIYKLKA